MTLRTFHFAGVASMNVTLGVPRLKEIINASKSASTPIMNVALEQRNSLYHARAVKGRIEKTTLEEVSVSITRVTGPHRAYIRIVLDMELIKHLALGLNANIVAHGISSNTKLKLKPKDIVVVDECKLRIWIPSDEYENLLYGLNFLATELPKMIVGGISTIERAVISKDGVRNNDGEVDRPSYRLVVEGLNLRAVMAIEGVNFKETSTNHIIEVEKTLGIEAARNIIIEQINFTMGEHGIEVDARHLKLLADLMTNRGEILGITRFGISKMKDSVLMLASFEKVSSVRDMAKCLGFLRRYEIHALALQSNPPRRSLLYSFHRRVTTSIPQLYMASMTPSVVCQRALSWGKRWASALGCVKSCPKGPVLDEVSRKRRCF